MGTADNNGVAGPKDQPAPDNDVEMKNPDGEWEDPAPMTASRPAHPKGDSAVDPEGQQGGTHGGSPARPSLKPAQIDGPLETAEQRKRRSSSLPS
jgi:hypothetical protein